MSVSILIPIETVKMELKEYDHVELSFRYWKGSGAVLHVQTVKKEDDGVSFVMFHNAKEQMVFESMTRNNEKKLASMWDGILFTIEKKEGRAWDWLNQFLQKNNLTLKS